MMILDFFSFLDFLFPIFAAVAGLAIAIRFAVAAVTIISDWRWGR